MNNYTDLKEDMISRIKVALAQMDYDVLSNGELLKAFEKVEKHIDPTDQEYVHLFETLDLEIGSRLEQNSMDDETFC